MNINELEFEDTAKAVYIMNDSARERYDNWKELKEFMVDMAYAYCHESNSFSTGGFVLTAYTSLDGKERFVRASVMSYVALRYAERVTKLKELAGAL
jgi:hypothetical protein